MIVLSSSKLLPIALAGGTLACVALAATVSATPPPGERVRAAVAPAPCTAYEIDIARHAVAGVARERALVGNATEKATDFVSAMQWIERQRGDDYWIHRNATRDQGLRLLARCGQSTTVERCVGYAPPSAYVLERNSWETRPEWDSRVANARAEAALCHVVLPEAIDPGPDCSPSGVREIRVRASSVLRELQIDRLTDTEIPIPFRAARLARRHEELRLAHEGLVSCGVAAIVDPCFGVDIDVLQLEVAQWRRYVAEERAKHRVDEVNFERAGRFEHLLTLCSK